MEADGVTLKVAANSQKSALDGTPLFVKDGNLTPDFYAVNTMMSPYPPSCRARSDSAPRISLDDFLVRRLRAIRRATVSGPLRSTSSCAPIADELRDQIDREALTCRPHMAAMRGNAIR